MKRRSLDPETPVESAELSLCEALLSLKNADEMDAFLRDLCTPAELEVLVDRWRVVPYLLEGVAYREIHERTAVSITTIGRVARFLTQGNGGYLAAAARASRRSTASKKVRAGSRVTACVSRCRNPAGSPSRRWSCSSAAASRSGRAATSCSASAKASRWTCCWYATTTFPA